MTAVEGVVDEGGEEEKNDDAADGAADCDADFCVFV